MQHKLSRSGDMMSLSPTVEYLTPEEYLALERHAESKSEYFNGEIIPMVGASRRHNLISGNIFASLHTQLRGRPYEPYTNDMRVGVGSENTYTYPDVVVVCGEVQLADEHLDTLLNPTLIVEVLSVSTETYDRGLKFEHYRKLDSLQEYLLVAQDKTHVEHYVRQSDDEWLFSEARNLPDTVYLPSINCILSLTDIYDRIDQNQ
jgi:Uma2 family endonuclease